MKPNPEIQKAILLLTPSLKADYVARLAIAVEKASNAYHVEWWVIVAILKQESNFDYQAVNWSSRDFGISQFNYKTIEYLKLDLGRLLTDKQYAIYHTARYLADLKKKYAKIDNKNGRVWYTRYHSFTPSFRTIYREKLYEHLKVIQRLSDVPGKRYAKGSGDYSGIRAR
jgi:hypothetical protein